MSTNGTKKRLASIVGLAIVALAVTPALAGSASAAANPSSTTVTTSTSWAYGGETSLSSPGLSISGYTLSWAANASLDVIYNATNTTANITELTGSRVLVVTMSLTGSGPKGSASYKYKAVENDLAYANVTNAATVKLQPGGTNVAALGILNASIHANASIEASVVIQSGNLTLSDYLNVSGWGDAKVAFSPALGLVPLNLTGVTAWTANALATGSAAWNVTWTTASHGWNGTSASNHGGFNGTWSKATQVYLNGSVINTTARWNDHRDRTGVDLNLSGPFNLHAGLFFVPRGFDLFRGAAVGHSLGAVALGASTLQSEYVYFNAGRISVESMAAASMSAGTTTPVALAPSGGGAQPASSPASQSSGTVWAQPESPQAAQSQATCVEYGCGGSASPFGGVLLPLAVAAVAAVVAVALVIGLRSRGRRGKTTDTTLSTQHPPMMGAGTTGTPSVPTLPAGSEPGSDLGPGPQ